MPWVSIADLNDGVVSVAKESLTAAGLANSSAKVVPAGTILVAMYGSIGKLGIAGRNLCTSQAIAFAQPDETVVDPRFLFHFLLAQRSHLQARGRGGTQMNIGQADLKEWPISLPPLEEQRRIAAILDKADAIRAKRRQVLAHLDALTQSIFHDMFSHVDLSSRQVSELAAVWDCPHSTPRWTDSGFVCVRTPNLIAGDWDWSDRRFVDDGQFKARTRGGGARPGDIILSREGTVGVAAIVQPGMEICMGQRLVQLRPNLDLVRSEYLLAYLLRALRPERIQQLMVGSTAQHLNVRDLRGLPVPVAPMDLQREFVSRAHRIGTQRVAARSAAGESERLFASLQSRAFRGEL